MQRNSYKGKLLAALALAALAGVGLGSGGLDGLDGLLGCGLGSLNKYAVEGIIGYSTAPLKIATVLGSFTSLLAVIYFIVVVLQRLICGVDVPGYATIVALILLIGGIQLLILGIMGEYIARMYIQGKQRPIFIEKDVLTNEDEV